MGQLDLKYLDPKAMPGGQSSLTNLSGIPSSGLTDRNSVMALIAAGVGEITSRDQIINPDVLLSPGMYKNTRRGRAQYESDLEALRAFQAQQEAAYEEWYNSPEQAAIRERMAGLNPDLVGLDNVGSASQVSPNESVPGADLPTDGQVAFDVINSAVSLMQTIGSLSALPLQFKALSLSNKLVDKQITGQELTNDGISLGNIAAFEQLAHKAISDKYATYHSNQLKNNLTPDIAAFFADDSNFEDIIPSYAPSDNPMYRNALSRVRKGSESIIADAYSISSDKVNTQTSLARVLANPWFDDDTKIMAANLSPLMEAIFKLEESTFQFNKQVIDFKKSYVGELDSKTLAQNYQLTSNYQRMLANHQAIIEGAKAHVYTNLRSIYDNAPYSPAGFRAANLIMGQAPNSIADFLTQYLMSLIDPSLVNEFHNYMDMDGDPTTNEGGIGWHPGRPSR